MSLTYNERTSGPIIGSIFANDRVEGYYLAGPPGTRSIAFVRYMRPAGSTTDVPVPAQVYLADEWLRGGWAGLFYALNVNPGGASAQHNVYLFQTLPPSQPCHANCNPTPPTVLPANAQSPFLPPNTPTPFWISVAGAQSLLLLTVAADGGVSGTAFGDQIIGHYAAQAGTIAFLRLQQGHPIQVFVGKLDTSGTMGGRVQPLAQGGGTSVVSWNVVPSNPVISRMLSINTRSQCLIPRDASASAGVRLRASSCSPNSTPFWALIDADPSANADWRLVSMVSGLCTQVLASANGFDLQPCSGAAEQTVQISDPPGAPITDAAVLTHRDTIDLAFNSSNTVAHGCIGLVPSSGDITLQECKPSLVSTKTWWGRW